MSDVFPYTIVIVLVVAALFGSWFVAQLILGKVDFRKKSEAKASEKREDGTYVLKETCDIYDKRGEPIRYECGHDDAPEYRLDLYGEPCVHKRPGKGTKLCSACLLAGLLKVVRRCGACGFAIKPGDPVALCVDDRRIGKKEWKTYVGKDLLVCLRWECDNGPGYCGHWMGDGIKPAFPDGGNHISQVFKTGEPLFTQIGPIDPSEPPSK